MSWNGTVNCSYCYQKGHNRRSCPSLTKVYLDRYMEAKNDGFSDDDRIAARRAEYVKRTGLDPDTGKKVKRKDAKAMRMKNVKCGYCGERGHTRRVCKVLRQDYEVYKLLTAKVRAERKRELTELGCGIGSIMPVKEWCYNAAGEYGEHETLRMVTSLTFDRIDAHTHDPAVLICRDALNLGPRGMTSGMTISAALRIVENTPTRVSMTGNASMKFPEGWDDATDTDIKAAFPVKQNRPYDYAWSGSQDIADAREQLGFNDD